MDGLFNRGMGMHSRASWRRGWLVIAGIGLAAVSPAAAPSAPPGASFQVRLVTGTIDTAPAAASFRQTGIPARKMAADLRDLRAEQPPEVALPVIIQFAGRIRPEFLEELVGLGVRVGGYLPDNAVLAEAPAAGLDGLAGREAVQWIGLLRPEDKIQPGLRQPDSSALSPPVPRGADRGRSPAAADLPALPVGPGELITITIRTLAPDAVAGVSAAVAQLGGSVLKASAGRRQGTIRAAVRPGLIPLIAANPRVAWIERYRQPRIKNNVAAGAGRMNVDLVRTNYGLTGRGQVIAVCDTGLDTGDTNTLHPDFTNRLRAAFGLARPGEWSDLMGHGTHVSGSILGNGSAWSNGLFKGIACEAELVMQSAGDASDNIFLPEDLNDLFMQTYTNAARLHSDSWGGDSAGEYTVECQQCDEFVWDHPDFLPLFSAGNEGTDADGDGVIDLRSIGMPASAKNVMAVGAAISDRPSGSGGYSSNTWGGNWYQKYPMAPIKDALVSTPADGLHQGLAAFSSRGPCQDGRIKPDIVAPGTDIISCRSRLPGASDLWGTGAGVLANAASNDYTFCGGTSMSTPLTAGAAGLTRQYLVETRGLPDPSAALIKALLLAGARSLAPGQYGAGAAREIPSGQRPNAVEGWGQVDLGNTLFPGGSRTNILVDGLSLTNGLAYACNYTPAASNRVSIVLAWSDYPGSPQAAVSLVNDLDLMVVTPRRAVLYPNGLGGPDRTNNLEGIDLDPAESGTYLILVSPHNVPFGPQPFALVIHESAPQPAALDRLWHDPAPVTSAAPVTIKAAFTAGANAFQEVLAYHRVDGGTWIGQTMSAEGAGAARAVYAASIQAPAPGGLVEYTIRAVPAAGAPICSATNVFTVWNGALYVSPSGAVQPPYDTPARGFTNIQAALKLAEPGIRIMVDAGVYRGETLAITQAVTLQSLHGAAATILDGELRRPCVSNCGLAVLDGFTLYHGYAENGGGASLKGGELRNCTIVSNLAESSGGGVIVDARGRVQDCVLHDNAASAGGGFACLHGGQLAGSVLRHNAARNYGGGAALVFGGAMSNCTVWGNAALTNGGGVILADFLGSYGVSMNNCLVVSNAAYEAGGGVCLLLGGTVDGCTLAGNIAPTGGGLYISTMGQVNNTIIHGNTHSNLGYSSLSPRTVRLENCCLTPRVDAADITVVNQLAADPLFRHPAGGDYRLCANSPCRDAGTNADWMAGATDLDGNARIINAIVDIGAYELLRPGNMWNFAAVRNAFGDFDGDGRLDPAVYEAASGLWTISLSAGGYQAVTALFGGARFMPAPGDYDGDRVTELALYDAVSGAWLLQTAGRIGAYCGGPGYLPVPGDYDGDGKTDPAVYHQRTGHWVALCSSAGYTPQEADLGGAGYEVVFGDYDGDSRTDPAVYGQAAGLWKFLPSASGYALTELAGGGPGYLAAAADYDGDGRADPTVYGESAGLWSSLLSSRGYAPAEISMGAPGCVPVPADYDNDGLADPALYQESGGLWGVRLSSQSYGLVTLPLGGPDCIAINSAR